MLNTVQYSEYTVLYIVLCIVLFTKLDSLKQKDMDINLLCIVHFSIYIKFLIPLLLSLKSIVKGTVYIIVYSTLYNVVYSTLYSKRFSTMYSIL